MTKYKKKKALILGGTGIIGQELVDEYLRNKYEVFVTTRNQRKSNRNDLFFININARDLNIMRDSFTGQKFDVVVDLMVYTVQEFDNCIKFLLDITKHYIFVSSYRIYADSPTPLVEDSPRLIDTIENKDYLDSGDYALLKSKQESRLSNLKSDHWTIVRPGITYGGNRFQLGTFEASVIATRSDIGLEIPLPFELLDTRCTLTSAKDVGFLICSLSCKKRAFRDDFNVMSSESITWREVGYIYQRILNTRIVPTELSKFYEISNDLWHLTYDRLYNRECSNTKILRFLSLENYEFVPILDGLESTLSGYLSSGETFSYCQNRTEGKIDRIVGNLQLKIVGDGGVIGLMKYFLGRFKAFDKIKRKMKV